MALSLRYGAVSDIGRSRKKNDDSGYAGPHLVMVADGMGGAAAGDLASAVAVETMQRLDAPAPDDMLEALAGAVHRANDRLAELIEEDPAVEGMGTTVTAALFDGEHIGVAHLGDSRGYLWRDGELLRITNDHTWVQSLIDDGRITEEQAKVHSHRSLLLKVLDGRHDNDPDLTVYDVQPGDRILICSDGLSGFVDHSRIERVLSIGTADSAVQELLQLALEGGSNDNVTVIVADVVDEPPADEAEPLVVGSAAEPPSRTVSRFRSWGHRNESAPGEALIDRDVDPEELRYAPRAPRRYRWVVRVVGLVLGLALIAFLAIVSYNWSQNQYYVASYDGKVAIYRGVQADLPGISLHHVFETEALLLTELPTFRRSQVLDGLQADNLDHAHSIVDKLKTFAATCASQAAASSTGTTTATTRTRTPTSSGTRQAPTSASPRSTRPGTAPTTTPKPRSRGQTSSTGPRSPATRATVTRTTSQAAPTSGVAPADNAPEECSGATPIPGTTS